jgi:hypothetical protein
MEKEPEAGSSETASQQPNVAEVDPAKKAQATQRYGHLLKLLKNKRDRDADDKLEEKAASSE